MSYMFRRLVVVGFVWQLAAAALQAQAPPTVVWLGKEGELSSDALDPTSWSPQQLPDATTRAVLTGGGNHNKVLNLGAHDVTWYQMFPNNNGPVTVNGAGTITIAIPYDASGNGDPLSGMRPPPFEFDPPIDEWGIFSAGGEAFGGPSVPSVINPHVITESYIETNGGHSLTFNGNVETLTVQAYAGTRAVFNGNVTLTASEFPDARFLTGNNTGPSITFNAGVALFPRDDSTATGFGIRNQLTVNLGPNATLSSNIDANGWGEVNLYNGSVLRLFGSNRLGPSNDVWSRGANSILTNTLDLNGHSDSVEFFGTASDSTLIVNYGATPGANTLLWEATHQMNGQYSITNFEIGSDGLQLGAPGNGFWFETGDPVAEAALLAQIKINGFSYAPFTSGVTTPYWTVLDPAVSRAVAFVNGPNANFDGVGAVTGRDFLIWQRGFGLTGQTTNANGDADRNGTVNSADFQYFKSQFGTTPPPMPVAGAVPEPGTASMALACVVGAGLLLRRRGAR
jgi:hypothetical protein